MLWKMKATPVALLVKLALINASGTFERSDVTFSVTVFGQCPPFLSGFRVFVDKQLFECVLECTLYSRCLGIAFRRDYLTCELFGDAGELFTDGFQSAPCVYVARSDMTVNITESETGCTNCSDEEVCSTNNDTCSIFECPPMEYHKGTLRGNIDEIGAKKRVTCVPRYMEVYDVTSVTCQPSGQWDYEPFCYRPMTLGEECFPSWLVYNVQLCEDTSATCEQSGVTSAHYCVCPNIYYDTTGPVIGGACKLKIGTSKPCTYNSLTTSVNVDMCVDVKAKCQTSGSSSTGYACLCVSGYFLGSNGICQKIIPIGGACQRHEQCYISYSQCSVTCQCIEGYRYQNGACERYSCPSTNVWLFKPGTNFAIRFRPQPTSMTGAILDCLSSGGRGVVILDELWKMDMIQQLLTFCPDYRNTEFWVDGFMTSLSTTDWFFSTGLPMPTASSFWYSKVLTVTRQCVVLGPPSWQFSTEDCTWYNSYICEL